LSLARAVKKNISLRWTFKKNVSSFKGSKEFGENIPAVPYCDSIGTFCAQQKTFLCSSKELNFWQIFVKILFFLKGLSSEIEVRLFTYGRIEQLN
jgi:hypothetical protein